MIKRLRKSFVLVSMGCVAFVLLLVLAVLNISAFYRFDSFNERTLTMISENAGVFPRPPEPENAPGRYSMRDMDIEAPFQTRFFTVVLDDKGELVSVDTGKIAAVSADEAVSLAQSIFKTGKQTGYSGNYKYQRSKTDNGYLFVFLDCTRDFYSLESFFNISIAVFASSVVLIFILVFILSKPAIKPIVTSYEKQKRFITDAGHEIKTPLAVIGSCTDVLEMELGENKWTAGIRSQVQRMNKLTQNMISLAKMDENPDNLRREELCISDMFSEIIDTYSAVSENDGLILKKDIQQNVSVVCDPLLMEQLCSILIDNVYKYASSGDIRFSLIKKGRKMILETENQVDGLSSGNHNELFDRFYRGDQSRSNDNPGNGIGLSIAQSIVLAHNGTIDARAFKDNCLTITVTI